MNRQEIEELKRISKMSIDHGVWKTGGHLAEVDFDFIEFTNPNRVLKLIEQIDAFENALIWYRGCATGKDKSGWDGPTFITTDKFGSLFIDGGNVAREVLENFRGKV